MKRTVIRKVGRRAKASLPEKETAKGIGDGTDIGRLSFDGELLKPDPKAPEVKTDGKPNLASLRYLRECREETVAIKRLALEERDYDRELGKADAPDWCDGLGWTTARPIREGLYLTRWDDKCPVRAVKVTSEPGFLAVVAGSIGIWPVTDAAGIWLGPIPWPDGKPEVPA